MSIFNVNARNYSIYTIPAAWILTQAVSTRVTLLARGLGSNTYPRDDVNKAAAHLPPSEAAKIKRQEAAHKNGLENFPLFATAMIVGNEAGLDSGTLNLIGVGYLITRGVYSWLYTNISTEKKSYLRTTAWWFGNFLCLYPLIKAGNVLAKF